MLRNLSSHAVRIGLFAGMLFVSAGAKAQNLPDGPAKQTVQTVCSQCHSLSFITNSRLTRPDWEYVVTDMIGRGAPLMEDEISSVIDYLAASFPKPVGKVNVNTAGAKDLQFGLGFTPKESEAIVAHREKNGKFGAAVDLSKVAGVDGKKVDAAKERMEF
jgi:competence ComEA-like helix-hairpin-helix protein